MVVISPSVKDLNSNYLVPNFFQLEENSTTNLWFAEFASRDVPFEIWYAKKIYSLVYSYILEFEYIVHEARFHIA